MIKQNKNKKDGYQEPRINGELKGDYDVRVIVANGDGHNESMVMPLSEAKLYADREEKDLIEINPKANPPIVRIDNYEKWLYNEKKKSKDNKQKKVELKEIQLTVNIGRNDLEVKAKKAKEFISDGDKVKVVLTIKGRENTRREESKKSLYEFLVMVSDLAVPESLPKDDGNRVIVILKRKK